MPDATNSSLNCHGCKSLDELKGAPKGTGYCCTVERSEAGKKWFREHSSYGSYGALNTSLKVRRPDMPRCELYEPGDFQHRFD